MAASNVKRLLPALLLIIIGKNCFVSSFSTFGSFTNVHRKKYHASPLFSSYQGNEGKTSIGNVVGNLHGGKYQFDTPGSSMNRIGQEFAESLYTSCVDEEQEQEDNEPWPNWAIRKLITSAVEPVDDDTPTLSLSSYSSDQNVCVQIINQERTWERFYARIISFSGSTESNDMPFQVSPITGVLAPSGGASNACDASKPYPDSANLILKHDKKNFLGSDSDTRY